MSVVGGFFKIKYILRIFSTDKPIKYIFSFYGIIDLLAILPMYLSFFITGSNLLSGVRVLLLLRLFRVMKLIQFVDEGIRLKQALKASSKKIIVFLYFVVIISVMVFFFSSRRRHTRSLRDWSSDVCSSDLPSRLRARHGSSCLAGRAHRLRIRERVGCDRREGLRVSRALDQPCRRRGLSPRAGPDRKSVV